MSPAVAPMTEHDALAAGLAHEAGLLGELGAALARQRAAVAADRVEEVRTGADDLVRLLQALEASRRHTRGLQSRLPQAAAHAGVAAAVQRVRGAARSAHREAVINSHLLRHGIAAGERFLQELFQSLDGSGGYGPAEAAPRTQGRIVDRRA